jgi:hypothetical protein
MKTGKLQKDDKMAIEEKRATDGHRWPQMEGAEGGHPPAVDSAPPRRRFTLRASEGSSVFKLLFPG